MNKSTILPVNTAVLFRVPGEMKEQHGKVWNYDTTQHLYQVKYNDRDYFTFVSQLNIIAYW